jgi:acyl carrier protein
MKLSVKIFNIIKKKYPNLLISKDTRVFEDLNLDSLEFAKLLILLEKKTNSKINLSKIKNFQNLKLSVFIKAFMY